MCGIVGIFGFKRPVEEIRSQALKMSKRIRHRGPDWSGIYTHPKAILAHERLSVVDPISGGQPLYTPDRKVVLAVNGEIYNHQIIRKRQAETYQFQTGSDCEVILSLYREYRSAAASAAQPDFVKMLEELNGIFAFALYDEENDAVLVARDHIGIIPLYIGTDVDGTLYVASELKALEGFCTKIDQFPPGHYLYCSADGKCSETKLPVKWYTRDWRSYDAVKDNPADIAELRSAFEAAVHRQLMTDVPYGVLLSGGLDSSIVSAVAVKYAAKRIETDDTQAAWYPRLHSFAVGLDGSPDLAASRKVADAIGTVHHEIHFTIQEGLDALRDVIYHLETYDVTTVRASTPMYLMSRVIKSMGIKMVLSGEGSDELFGGYLYFHKAPSAKDLHEETVRKLDKLYLYDCLRANKSLASWGVEGRVPFLDKEFIDIAMRFNPEEKLSGLKNRMEKWALRKAFEDYLPHEIAWRQKEQFSDGVGYSWIDTLRQVASSKVSDADFANAGTRFPINPPMTKEEYHYRTIFEELFPSDSAAASVPSVPSVACSTPVALEWDAAFKNMVDPSGRAVKSVHNEAY
ncbi:MAG: asparagine synthase B [Planctomycetaceae bacterium]|jgi:asparagine synthase (glutamine-hydrolysing)|nr:asparagine synthase B [Planctomycetaceae bacterium]